MGGPFRKGDVAVGSNRTVSAVMPRQLGAERLQREVVGLIVNIRFKNPPRDGVGITSLFFCVIFRQRLGSGTPYARTEQPIIRTIDGGDSDRAAPHRSASCSHDREWLHRPQIP